MFDPYALDDLCSMYYMTFLQEFWGEICASSNIDPP
jgi:hypothetical protein